MVLETEKIFAKTAVTGNSLQIKQMLPRLISRQAINIEKLAVTLGKTINHAHHRLNIIRTPTAAFEPYGVLNKAWNSKVSRHPAQKNTAPARCYRFVGKVNFYFLSYTIQKGTSWVNSAYRNLPTILAGRCPFYFF
jgi:hypothetical protein